MIALADARGAARERARDPAREPALERVQITAPALARGPVRGPARVRVRERAQRRVRMIAPALARGPVREAALEVALEIAPEAVTQLARRIAQITVLVPAPADVRAAALVRGKLYERRFVDNYGGRRYRKSGRKAPWRVMYSRFVHNIHSVFNIFQNEKMWISRLT